MPRLTSLSFAHPTVLSEQRAILSLSPSHLRRAHEHLDTLGHQAFLLSTCLRVEIAWAGDPESAAEVLASLYGDRAISNNGTIRTDREALVHLCRVAAGLNSPLVGEPEVLGQFRQAVLAYQECYSDPSRLRRILETAIGIGRSTRRLLGDTPRGSLAALAANAASHLGRVAILGRGAMARAAAEHLDGVEVSVFARRPGQVGGHQALGWELAPEALAAFPAVISTVPGKTPLFSGETIAAVFARRTSPLLLIDLGMPPGFARPDFSESLSYVGIDDLASSVRARPQIEAEAIVVRDATAVWNRITAPDRAGKVIGSLVEQADAAVSEEVERLIHRLSKADDPERILRQLGHTVARRILHPPISFLGSTDQEQAVAVLAEAFGVEDD